jgi:hypothetical protein
MAKRPLRKAAPTAGGILRNGIEIPDQDGRFVDDDLPPIVVEWSWRDAMTPSPTCDYESCMTGYVTPINQTFEC